MDVFNTICVIWGSLSHIFVTPQQFLEDLLDEFYAHNWHDAQGELVRPLEETLFFAGEATNDKGHHATVHGGIANGLRAAKEILRA